MYAALFAKLSGGRIAKFLQFTVILTVFISLLFFVIFPFVENLIAEDPSLNG
jgi:hypothetical protein